MDGRDRHGDAASGEEKPDSPYDRYLEAASRGAAESPEEFFRRNDVTDPEMRSLITSIHASATTTSAASCGPLSILDDFELIRPLGEGAMGIVHLARQRSLDRLVAVKVIRPEVARSPSAAMRFEREAKAIARLRHPGIVTVHAVGEAKGVRYIAMELVEGRGLDRVIADARQQGDSISPATALGWLASIAEALAFAHEHGIVHRDVKPSNIIIGADGRPLLLDFGVARDLESDAATLTEAFVGSPSYIAPEQVGRTGKAIDGRADVYSLGVVLYECVTGRTPFGDGTLEQVLGDIIARDPPAPRTVNPSLARDLETVIVKAMQKDPARRYASAAALADDLRALLEYRPIVARPPSPIQRVRQWSRRRPAAAAVALTAAIGVAGFVAFVIGSSLLEQRRVRAEMNETLHEATALIEDQGAAVRALHGTVTRLAEFRVGLFSRYVSDEDHASQQRAEADVARYRLERDERYHRVLSLLEHANDLGANRERTKALRTRLYLTMHIAARVDGDTAAADAFAGLVRRTDPDGYKVEERTLVDFSIHSVPSGAEVFLFRVASLADLDDQAERRNILVPWRSGRPPWDPGMSALRVVTPAGDLRAGDLVIEVGGHPIRDTIFTAETTERVVEIDGHAVRCADDVRRYGENARSIVVEREGERVEIPITAPVVSMTPRERAERGGVPARVWSGDAVREVILPAGLDLRVTAAPAPVGDGARAGVTPIDALAIERGEYRAVLRRAGFEDSIVAVTGEYPCDAPIRLHPVGTTPSGFIHVPSCEDRKAGGFWIMEHEVTIAQYDEFLNDPQTLDTITEVGESIFVPRFVQGEIYYHRGEDGRYRAPTGYTRSHPIFGVSWHDANAYAAWMTDRARERGLPHRYDLPSRREWLAAAAARSTYPYGEGFRPRWFSSCFTRPAPAPEPVMSFPIDQSVLGVYDMTGSMAEWLADAWSDRGEQKFVKGGSWAHGGPEDRFRLSGGTGVLPTFTDGTTGFRLVLYIGELDTGEPDTGEPAP